MSACTDEGHSFHLEWARASQSQSCCAACCNFAAHHLPTNQPSTFSPIGPPPLPRSYTIPCIACFALCQEANEIKVGACPVLHACSLVCTQHPHSSPSLTMPSPTSCRYSLPPPLQARGITSPVDARPFDWAPLMPATAAPAPAGTTTAPVPVEMTKEAAPAVPAAPAPAATQ